MKRDIRTTDCPCAFLLLDELLNTQGTSRLKTRRLKNHMSHCRNCQKVIYLAKQVYQAIEKPQQPSDHTFGRIKSAENFHWQRISTLLASPYPDSSICGRPMPSPPPPSSLSQPQEQIPKTFFS